MSKGTWRQVNKATAAITSYYECSGCRRKYYSSNDWGFFQCIYSDCRSTRVLPKIDDSGGKLSIPTFQGAGPIKK